MDMGNTIIKRTSVACCRAFAVVACALLPFMAASADEGELRRELRQLLSGYDAGVGVAVVADCGDTVTVNNDRYYPLMSVVKLHQAIYVAHYLDSLGLSMDYEVYIAPGDLKPNTYSPLRDRYPQGGITMTVGELLLYTLQQSDNNACDIMFARFGGPSAVDAYIRGLGFDDCAISVTEDDMHRDPALCHANYSSPLEAARLIGWLMSVSGQHGNGSRNLQFVRNALLGCRTGLQRIPDGLPPDAIVAHKTGTSDRDATGRWTAINDVAHITLPGGCGYSLAVFVKDSGETFDVTEQIISSVSHAVASFMQRQ